MSNAPFVRFRQAGLLWPALAMLVALSILIGLGTWQWQRKTWKEELIATIAARSSAAPLDIAAFELLTCKPLEQAGLAKACDYTKVRLKGTFDHQRERHVYTGISKPAGAAYGGQGFWIMTPFQLSSGGKIIAVNRGFVPEAFKEPATRSGSQLAGEIDIVGLIRSAEPRATFTATNDPAKNFWYLRNPVELFTGTPGLPLGWNGVYIDLLSPQPSGRLPQPTAGRIDIPNRHLEYALTWWALAVTLLGVFGFFAASRVRPNPAKPVNLQKTML